MTTPSPELAALLVRIGNVAGSAARPTSLARELKRAAAGVRGLFDAAACSVALVEPDGESLRFAASDGAGAALITGVQLPIGKGIAGWVVMSGQGIALGDVQGDSRFAREVAEATKYVPDSILAVPLMDDQGSVLGVLEVLDPASGSGDTGQLLDLLGTIGDQISSIVTLAQVYDQLGAALLRSVAEAEDPDGFGAALAELAGPGDEGQLAALAASFHELASLGPEAAHLAQRVLEEVATYARGRR